MTTEEWEQIYPTIPTAEVFVNFLEAKGIIFPNKKEKLRTKNSFIEFAKMHVEQALKSAQELCITEAGDILNAYPLTNII